MTTVPVHSSAPDKGIIETINDTTVWQAFGICVLFATATLNLISLSAEKSTVELDAQVIVKLMAVAAAGLYGSLGFLTDPRVRSVASSFPANCLVGIVGLYFCASLFGISPGTSLVSSISILAIFLMTLTAMINLGQLTCIRIVFVSASTFLVGSWLAYLLMPESGILAEPIGDGEYQIRMRGLAHPNTLGQFSGICILTGTFLYFTAKRNSRFVLLMISCSIVALLFSLSRSSMLATVVAVLVGYRQQLFTGRKFVRRATIMLSFSIIAIMVASTQFEFETLLNEKIHLLAKSGDADEIFSATGRGEIWAETIRLIKERPILGYGPTSSKFLLEDYSFYTHNMFLNIGLSCGVGGVILAIVMAFGRVGLLFTQANPIADALVIFVLLNGVFENVIFANISGLPTICWIVGLTWFHVSSVQQGGANV